MPTSRPVPTSDELSNILSYYTDISELAEEMSNWRDSIPDSMQSSEKYDQVDTAATVLEDEARNLESDCDHITSILESASVVLEGVDIKYVGHMMYKGYQAPRWVRLSNALAGLKAAMEFIENSMSSWSLSDGVMQELKEYMSNVDDAISNLEQVEFPSMYG